MDYTLKIPDFLQEEAAELANGQETSPEDLEKLSNHDDWYVRFFVATNGNTSQETLSKLANDEDSDVVEQVILNNNTPREVVEKIRERLKNEEIIQEII